MENSPQALSQSQSQRRSSQQNSATLQVLKGILRQPDKKQGIAHLRSTGTLEFLRVIHFAQMVQKSPKYVFCTYQMLLTYKGVHTYIDQQGRAGFVKNRGPFYKVSYIRVKLLQKHSLRKQQLSYRHTIKYENEKYQQSC